MQLWPSHYTHSSGIATCLNHQQLQKILHMVLYICYRVSPKSIHIQHMSTEHISNQPYWPNISHIAGQLAIITNGNVILELVTVSSNIHIMHIKNNVCIVMTLSNILTNVRVVLIQSYSSYISLVVLLSKLLQLQLAIQSYSYIIRRLISCSYIAT